MTGRINRCAHCGCDEPIYNAIDGKLYCNICGMSLEKLEGGLTIAENKMAQVAQLFGKKLDEKFWARIVGNEFEIKCRFTANGFQQTVVDGLWHDNDAFLSLLLTGKAEIVRDEK